MANNITNESIKEDIIDMSFKKVEVVFNDGQVITLRNIASMRFKK